MPRHSGPLWGNAQIMTIPEDFHKPDCQAAKR